MERKNVMIIDQKPKEERTAASNGRFLDGFDGDVAIRSVRK